MALNDFTYYANRSLGGISADEISSDRAKSFLTELQKYDPNASFRPTYGSEGNLTGYTLDFNASKLPGLNGGLLGPTSGGGSGADYVPNFSTVQDQMTLTDPNAVQNSDVYGKVTANTNIAHPTELLDYLGPLLVGAFGFGIGGIPGFTEGFGAQFQAGAGAATDPFLAGGTGAMDMAGSAGTGIPGSFGANAPLGSAESSLFGTGVQADPASAFGGSQYPLLDTSGDSYLGLEGAGTQAAAPITDLSTPARVGDVIRNGGIPGLDNIGQSLSELAGGLNLGDIAKAIPGLLGGAPGAGGGGGGLLAMGQKPQLQYEDLTKILGRFYGRA